MFFSFLMNEEDLITKVGTRQEIVKHINISGKRDR